MVTIDFETEAIVDGCPIPPRPVGVAIKVLGQPPEYLAWGHPTGNNCKLEDAIQRVASHWGEQMVFHNAAFDLWVAEYWFGLPPPHWHHVEDTMIQAYLVDPNANTVALKPLAELWLGHPPEERDEITAWVIANVPECRSRKQAGAHICKVPGELVGRYACGDVLRTEALYAKFFPIIEKREMVLAYEREMRLLPILLEMHTTGVRVDMPLLLADKEKYTEAVQRATAALARKLGDINFDSTEEVIQALIENGYANEENFLRTPKGNHSASKESLAGAINDPELFVLLRYRDVIAHLLGTYITPWLATAQQYGGRIYPSYNQTRNDEGYGTRTGRLSSSNPNLQNVPKAFDEVIPEGYPAPPQMRAYLLPEEGEVWVTCDLKSQEPRLTAHFENGRLLKAYQENPDLDPYPFVGEVIQQGREESKRTFLGLIYAMGDEKLGRQLGIAREKARELKESILNAFPDVRTLIKRVKSRFRQGLPIRTVGGRLMYCEPPSGGRTWEYKGINTLIQGSAADQTKEMLIYLHEHGAKLRGTVHDDTSISANPLHNWTPVFEAAANALPVDVPMRVTVKSGTNYYEATKK